MCEKSIRRSACDSRISPDMSPCRKLEDRTRRPFCGSGAVVHLGSSSDTDFRGVIRPGQIGEPGPHARATVGKFPLSPFFALTGNDAGYRPVEARDSRLGAANKATRCSFRCVRAPSMRRR
jgi:hypothetical protein